MSAVTPNFLIAGAARSGTTALGLALAQHPEVFVTKPKEPHFYAHAGSPFTYRGPGDELGMNRRVITDPSRFLALFEEGRDCSRRGDASVSTLVRPDVAIPNIHRHATEDVRLIAILREPVERAYSSYLFLRGLGHESAKDFDQALALEAERERKGYHHLWRYRELSGYRRQLDPFVDAFGDRLRVVIFEEYKSDPDSVCAELCRFLDIDDGFRFDTSIEVSRGGEPRNPLLTQAIRLVRSNPLVHRAARRITRARFRERVRSSNLSRPELDVEARRRLGRDFADDVLYVEGLIGRELTEWRI